MRLFPKGGLEHGGRVCSPGKPPSFPAGPPFAAAAAAAAAVLVPPVLARARLLIDAAALDAHAMVFVLLDREVRHVVCALKRVALR